MNSPDPLREPEPAFAVPTMPLWVKLGGGLVAVLVLAALVVVVASPSSPAQKPVSTAIPAVQVTAAGSVTTLAPGALDARGGLGVTPGTEAAAPPTTSAAGAASPGAAGADPSHPQPNVCWDPYPGPCGPTTTAGPRGLRLATSSEVTAIASEVPPPAGQHIDDVQISETDETWGLLHVAAGAGHREEWVLIHEASGHWQPVDSGFPELACYPSAPASVISDLAGHIASC